MEDRVWTGMMGWLVLMVVALCVGHGLAQGKRFMVAYSQHG